MRPEFTVAPPERREDGTWRYPLQVIIQTVGRWAKGSARFETIGYADSPAGVGKLTKCLI